MRTGILIAVRFRLGQGFQELDQVGFVLSRQPQAEAAVIVIHDVEQSGKAAVVVEPARGVRPETLERRSTVAAVGRAVRLKAVDADFAGGVHVPAWLGVERGNMTAGTLAAPVEDRLAALR